MPPSIQTQGLSGRRKACDACCRRKTKCDARKPVCSGCALHHTDCEWTPGLVKTPQKHRSLDVSRSLRAIEDRLAHLESRLPDSDTPLSGPTTRRPNLAESIETTELSLVSSVSFAQSQSETEPEASSVLRHASVVFGSREEEAFPLPPEDLVYDCVDVYSYGFNCGIPLFHPTHLRFLLDGWFLHKESPDEATWAVINVMIALSHRHSHPRTTIGDDSLASTAIDRAQSAMTSLVYRDKDAKGLQVLLGLTMLFLSSAHPHPACIFIASAVKLVHRLGLHTQKTYGRLERDEADQRQRLFWITYILDREISMLTMEPYLIQDRDVDVSSVVQPGLWELTWTLGSDRPFGNPPRTTYLNLRIELARFQGEVCDQLYSVRAPPEGSPERQDASSRLYTALTSWENGIPLDLRLDEREGLYSTPAGKATSSLGDTSCYKFAVLLYGSLSQTLFMTHQLRARNKDWIGRLMTYDPTLTGPSASTKPLLPPHWSQFVCRARQLVSIWMVNRGSDRPLTRRMACAWHAAIVIIFADTVAVAEHGDGTRLDTTRLAGVLGELSHELASHADSLVEDLHRDCIRLGDKARDMARKYGQKRRT